MDSKIKENPHRFPLWPQWLAATEVFLISIAVGLSSGWVSPYLAKLSKPDSPLQITKEEASWIASIIWISKLVGVLLETICVRYIGSKSSTLMSGFFFALGWMSFLFRNSVSSIYAFRIFSGIGIGILFNSFPLYIGEISDPKIRGALVSLVMQGIMAGNLIGNTMGAYLDTWTFAAISLVPNFIFIFLFILVPHSPHYLVRNNKLDEAARSIQWYNRNANVSNELESLQNFIRNSRSVTFTNSLRDISTPINRKTLWMVIGIFGFFQLSGLYTVTAYMEIMLIKSHVTVITPATMVIIVSTLGIISSWVAIYTNDKFGRTIMLTISSIGIATGLFLWGLNFQLLDIGFNDTHLQWMALMAAMIFKISLAIGFIPIPPTLTSEMFAPNVKCLGICITNILSSLFAFAGSKSYQPMVDTLSEKYVFWIYALLMVSAGIYTMVFIPETKGKSLAEIQDLLSGRKNIDRLTDKEYQMLASEELLGINKKTFEITVES